MLAAWEIGALATPVTLIFAIAGVVGAAFTAPGPIFALYFTSLGLDRRGLASVIGLAAIATGLPIFGAFRASGVLDGPRALMAFLGIWIGDRLDRRLPVEIFRRPALPMLFCRGLHRLRRALG